MRFRDESGMTVVELVVVITIIGVLAFVSYPLITNTLYVLKSKGAAEQVAGAVRQAVEATISAPGGRYPMTVSVGLAAFPDDGKTPEEIVWAADEALYGSKRGGRNRVTAYVLRPETPAAASPSTGPGLAGAGNT